MTRDLDLRLQSWRRPTSRPASSAIVASAIAVLSVAGIVLLSTQRETLSSSAGAQSRSGVWSTVRSPIHSRTRPGGCQSYRDARLPIRRHTQVDAVAIGKGYPSFVDAERARDIEEAACQDMLKSMRHVPVDVSFSSKPISTTVAGGWVSDQPSELAGGAPVVLLHGFDSSVLEFRRLVPRLQQQGISSFAIDLIGWGFAQAEEPTAGISPREKREHLYQYWKQHIGKPIVLCGASLGGAVAIDFALEHPDAVAGLVLIDAQAYIDGVQSPPEFMMNIGLNVLRSEPLRQIANVQSYYDKDTYATKDAMLIGRLHTYMPNWKTYNKQWMQGGGYVLSGRIKDLSVPTLIMWGEQDKILGTEPASRFEQDIANARLVWVPECGHVPHLEQADLTTKTLEDFMNSLNSS
eukprot:jgi/Bigna1/90806/estExt_fgenesh1_pg.C_800009